LNRAITKRRLTPGSILRFSDISIQPHVVAGQSTTLRLTKPQFTLTLEMLALEDGYIGDRIRVRNIESQEIVFATVIDVGLVEIQQ
jgi:flagella basal body P-ring formation protein FlgA